MPLLHVLVFIFSWHRKINLKLCPLCVLKSSCLTATCVSQKISHIVWVIYTLVHLEHLIPETPIFGHYITLNWFKGLQQSLLKTFSHIVWAKHSSARWILDSCSPYLWSYDITPRRFNQLRFGVSACRLWVRGLKSPNFPDSRILRAKNFQTKCADRFCDICDKNA